MKPNSSCSVCAASFWGAIWDDIKEGDPALQIFQSIEERSKRQRCLERKHSEGKLGAKRHQFDLEEQRQKVGLTYTGKILVSEAVYGYGETLFLISDV